MRKCSCSLPLGTGLLAAPLTLADHGWTWRNMEDTIGKPGRRRRRRELRRSFGRLPWMDGELSLTFLGKTGFKGIMFWSVCREALKTAFAFQLFLLLVGLFNIMSHSYYMYILELTYEFFIYLI